MKLKSAEEVIGKQEMVFNCNDCGVELKKPVELTSLYVMRDGTPMLLCPKCVKETDLYVWGDKNLI